MAFYRIVTNSEEDLEKIVNHIKNWFENSKDYKTEKGTEKRKFQDPDTKEISESKVKFIEKQIHKVIAHKRTKGEWFNIDLNDAISEVNFAVIRYENI